MSVDFWGFGFWGGKISGNVFFFGFEFCEKTALKFLKT